jgi:secreted trypsin-like serine protease
MSRSLYARSHIVRRLSAIAGLGVVLLACSATPDAGREESSSTKQHRPIVNGTETSDWPATGMMMVQGQVNCTGTVVAPRKVLTAGHCIQGQSPWDLSFAFGPSDGQIEGWVEVVDAVAHPDYDDQSLSNDIAVLTLAEDAPVAPVDMNPSMDASWIGETVTLVGYGVTDGPSQVGIGTKREVDVVVDDLQATTLGYTTTNGQTACNGDSGGPAYATPNGTLVIAGITSYGDLECKEYGVYTRVDAFLPWIEGELAKPPPADPVDPTDPTDPGDPYPPDPGYPEGEGCGGISWEGQCDGNVVVWCEGGELWWLECMAGCGFVPEAGYFDCL